MRYADLSSAIPERIRDLISRNEDLSKLHKELVTEVCIENGKFEYDNKDNPAQVGNFYREDLSDKVIVAYRALSAALMAHYAISLPDVRDQSGQ